MTMDHPYRRNDGGTISAEAVSGPMSRSAHCRDDERAFSVSAAIGPALRDDLVLGPEANAFLAILSDVAKARALPAAEAVVGDGHGDRHVDPDHSDIDSGRELAGRMAVAREDRDAVAILMARREAEGFFK